MSTTTMAPPVAIGPSQGQGATRAARGRIARDGNTFDGDFADLFLLPHEDDFYAHATNTLFMNVPVLAPTATVPARWSATPCRSFPHGPNRTMSGPRRSARSTAPTSSTTRQVHRFGRACISVALADHPAAPSSMRQPNRSCAPSTWVVRSTRARWPTTTDRCGCCGSPTATAVASRP